jgi:hypothetical protein
MARSVLRDTDANGQAHVALTFWLKAGVLVHQRSIIQR